MKENGVEVARVRLEKSGVIVVVGTLLHPVITALMILVGGGSLESTRIWIYLGSCFFLLCPATVVLCRTNPELLNHRGNWKKKKDAKRWDRLVVIPIYGMFAFYLTPELLQF